MDHVIHVPEAQKQKPQRTNLACKRGGEEIQLGSDCVLVIARSQREVIFCRTYRLADVARTAIHLRTRELRHYWRGYILGCYVEQHRGIHGG